MDRAEEAVREALSKIDTLDRIHTIFVDSETTSSERQQL
jgi:hypothetical protein